MDITVKSATPPGSVLAPTWDIVKAYKAGKLTQWQYAGKYYATIMNRLMQIGDEWRLALDTIGQDYKQITLVCFCPAGQFCHRILAARLLEDMSYGTYKGEWNLKS